MFGPARANQLLSKIAEQQAIAKDNEAEAVVAMDLVSELALIVAEQAKEIERLKSYVNQRVAIVDESRDRESGGFTP
jgi:hypothetical protein